MINIHKTLYLYFLHMFKFLKVLSALHRLEAFVKQSNSLSEAEIQIQDFHHRYPEIYYGDRRNDDSNNLISQLCRYSSLDSLNFRRWAEELHEPWRAHRKLWELAFISQALNERDMLKQGKRGLGFAVGSEKLPALFASKGCHITATDLPADDERHIPWAETGQWAQNLEQLNQDKLCNPDLFNEHVKLRPADMNNIPEDLRNFDFTWSTCSFEHCGSLDLGLTFLERQMDCLKPGGVAVHTTELNLTSNDQTIDQGPTVIYRLKDIENILNLLRRKGHDVEPLDISPGNHPLDRFVDEPPYCDWDSTPPKDTKHLRLNIGGYAATSIGIIMKKAS